MTMRKVVINNCYGGFSLSLDACAALGVGKYDARDIARDDTALVTIVETMGKAANGPYASLKIVEIPADVEWVIEEYDGMEWVAEKHRTWR